MTRNELTEMIRREISSLAFETLRMGANKNKEKEPIRPKGLTEDELEFALFYGGDKPKEGTSRTATSIRENYESGIPQINSSDITKFEKSFDEMLIDIDGSSVTFDKQSNGYSIKMWIGQEGIQAGASGVIEMGNKGRVKFAYSLKNGLTVSTEDLIIEQNNKRLLENLYDNYDAWQKVWRKLTIAPVGPENVEPPMEEPVVDNGEANMGDAGELPV
jgi:hypothetical protein